VPGSALVDRAIRFLSERGDASSAELARHVFGGESFAPLLNTLADERLRFDGQRWLLRTPVDDWAVLEMLCTGPNPKRHRIAAVAALRSGRRFQALVAGDKPIPKLLRKLGVPAESEAGEWQTLEDVARELRAFLGGATVVGFSYVPEYIEQLLGPAWPAIDLLRLLFRVSYYAGRPDPFRLARHFGLPAPANRRPEGMLRLSAALFERLRGQRSMAELREMAAPRAAPRPMVPELPSQPGVYVFSAAAGEALYVGKSIDLRRRVGSYLGRPIAESRGLYHLTPLASRIEVVPVSDELEAVLLEARLIAELQPAFNVQRRSGARCRYVRLSTGEAFPRLTTCTVPREDGATYFGPFRHATAAQRLRMLLGVLLRLRTCTRELPPRRKPKAPCAKAAAGNCLAPCIIGPPHESYSREVELARALLTAEPEQFRRILLRLLRERPPEPKLALRLKRLLESLAGTPARSKLPSGQPEEQAGGHDSSVDFGQNRLRLPERT
jgi:hypothetical protein